MSNPLLEPHALPPFSRIEPAHVEPAIRQLIERNKQRIDELLASNQNYTWDNLLLPIEELEDELSQAWSPVSHLNSVCNSDALREAYNACLPQLSEYGTWMGQHSQLCAAYQQIADSAAFKALDTAQRKSIEHALRDFRLAGVALPPDKKSEYGELRQRLSKLGSKFSENVLDATNAWSKQVTREQLQGLPETALANARQAAAASRTGALPDQSGISLPVAGTELLRQPGTARRGLHRQLYPRLRARSARRPVGQYRPHRGNPRVAHVNWPSYWGLITTQNCHWPPRWPTPRTRSWLSCNS